MRNRSSEISERRRNKETVLSGPKWRPGEGGFRVLER
jgi:hypothetical protein